MVNLVHVLFLVGGLAAALILWDIHQLLMWKMSKSGFHPSHVKTLSEKVEDVHGRLLVIEQAPKNEHVKSAPHPRTGRIHA